jgi:hypothetical protein
MIIEGLSNLAMKPNESTGELLARITNTMVILKESYASYENKPTAPVHHDINGGFTLPTARRWRGEALNNAKQFLKMRLFRAALPAELQKVVAQRNPNTLMLDDMYQIAMDTQREAGPKIKQAVTAVHLEERECSEGDEEIAAFQRRKGSKSTDRKKSSNPKTKMNYKGYSSNYKSASGPGNNAYRNGKYCFYCKLQNHTQEDCFKRIRDKKPYTDRQGRAYWPRVYLTSNSDQHNQ